MELNQTQTYIISKYYNLEKEKKLSEYLIVSIFSHTKSRESDKTYQYKKMKNIPVPIQHACHVY